MVGPDSAPSSSSFSMVDAELSGAMAPSSSSSTLSSSPSSSSLDREVEGHRRFVHAQGDDYRGFYGDRRENPVGEHRNAGILDWGNVAALGDVSVETRDESLSCLAVVFTFWLFVSMTLILGVYGPTNMRIGPNSSILVELDSFFVQSIKVEQLDDMKPGLKLHGFYKSPPLDVVETWSETHLLSVPADSNKGWVYYLNEGSSLNISYNVKSQGSSVVLVIAQGSEGLSQWLEGPAYPNTTLSWNLIHGSGIVQQKIYRSSSYYVAVSNLNSENVKVELDTSVRAFLYDTTESFYKCTFGGGECKFDVMFPDGNSVVLTSLGFEQETSINEWYIRLSYQPRWITYIVGIGGMTGLMLVALNFLRRTQCAGGDGNLTRNDGAGSQSAPLLSNKDDEDSSMGSSYESISNDDADLEDFTVIGSLDGKSAQEGETSNNTRRLCAICFDAQRDCFFLPCGHCVSCFECGTRIAEAAGSCPICRRKMKKVRRIYTV